MSQVNAPLFFIQWFDPYTGEEEKPGTRRFWSAEQAQAVAEEECERHGGEIPYAIREVAA